MARLLTILCLLTCFLPSAVAQTPVSSPTVTVTRDPQAISLLQQSVAAMLNGTQVTDISMSGTAIHFAGSDNDTGTVILQAKGTTESKVAITLAGNTTTELRSFQDGAETGTSTGTDGKSQTTAFHNCFTDSAWFFPALSSVASAVANQGMNASYVGAETVNGISVQHVRVWQSIASPDEAAVTLIAHVSTMDWYLDGTSGLPMLARFTTHPTDNASLDQQAEVRFANYQAISGVMVPLHIQRLLNNALAFDFTFASATLNSGLPDSTFISQ
jgi:hypothetical protein